MRFEFSNSVFFCEIDIGAMTEPASGYLIHHKKYKYNSALEHHACQKPTPIHYFGKDF